MAQLLNGVSVAPYGLCQEATMSANLFTNSCDSPLGQREFRPSKALLLIVLVATIVLVASMVKATTSLADRPVDLEVFVRKGCPHCEAAKVFLDTLQHDRPLLNIVVHDVRGDPQASARLTELANQQKIQVIGVPAFYLGGELIIGYDSAGRTGARIRSLLDLPAQAPPVSEPTRSPEGTGPRTPSAAPQIPPPEGIDVPFFGRLTVEAVGLPLFTFAMGLVDGFNPCSMWVLLFVLAMLASLQDRFKMLVIAGTFVTIEGLAYFAFMAAWLNMFLLVGLSRVSEVILGGIAILAGAINVKDFWAFRQGISLGIPEAAKPGLYARIRSILQAENLSAALAGVVALAVLVQIVEFLCTAGLPALYTRILTMRHLDSWAYYGYLLLYNLAYMLDDVMVLAIGVVTLSQRRLQAHEGRWLKLVGGMVMLGLGVILIAKPEWLAW